MSTVDLHPVNSANWRACAALSVTSGTGPLRWTGHLLPVPVRLWGHLASVGGGERRHGRGLLHVGDRRRRQRLDRWPAGRSAPAADRRRARRGRRLDHRFAGEPRCPGWPSATRPTMPPHEPSTAPSVSPRPAKPKDEGAEVVARRPFADLDADETSWRTVTCHWSLSQSSSRWRRVARPSPGMSGVVPEGVSHDGRRTQLRVQASGCRSPASSCPRKTREDGSTHIFV